MLRFHVDTGDMLRLRVAAGPHPFWEIYFSLLLLQTREAALHFDPWRRTVRRALAEAGLTGAVGQLFQLYPPRDYSPDFLAPGNGLVDLEEGMDRLMSTPRSDLESQMTLLAGNAARSPAWFRRISEGDSPTMKHLGDVLRRYYKIAVAPYVDPLRQAIAGDREIRTAAFAEAGVEGILASYPTQLLALKEGALHVPCPVDDDFDFRVDGRAVTLLPSFFALQSATSASDESPVTVAYPVERPLGWHARTLRPTEVGAPPLTALTHLIGKTRAGALDCLDETMSTSRIAAALKVSLPTASRAAAAMREAGLITSQRRGQEVLHTRTELGTALLEGQLQRTAPVVSRD